MAGGLAFNGQGLLVEQRAGKERRSHCLLAVAAMAETNIDRLALAPEPNRAAQASAFPDHGISAGSSLESGLISAQSDADGVAQADHWRPPPSAALSLLPHRILCDVHHIFEREQSVLPPSS